MTRRCFLVNGIEPGAETVELPADAAHHLQRVLRLRSGDEVELRDGLGNAWSGVIARVGKREVLVRVGERLDAARFESPLEITLALGIARSDLMDLAIRQATEMGVARVAVFRASRSQYSLPGAGAGKKLERWAKIAREAVCQCGRTRVPKIEIFEGLDSFLAARNPGGIPGGSGALGIFALEREHEGGIYGLKTSHPDCSVVLAAIGPEGGWDDSEIVSMMSAGFHPVHLGPRILRFETAAVALVSLIQLLWGDFGRTGRKGEQQK